VEEEAQVERFMVRLESLEADHDSAKYAMVAAEMERFLKECMHPFPIGKTCKSMTQVSKTTAFISKGHTIRVTDTPGLNDKDEWKELENMTSVFRMLQQVRQVDLVVFLFPWTVKRVDVETKETLQYYAKLLQDAVKMQKFVLVFTKVPADAYQDHIEEIDDGELESEKQTKVVALEEELGFKFHACKLVNCAPSMKTWSWINNNDLRANLKKNGRVYLDSIMVRREIVEMARLRKPVHFLESTWLPLPPRMAALCIKACDFFKATRDTGSAAFDREKGLEDLQGTRDRLSDSLNSLVAQLNMLSSKGQSLAACESTPPVYLRGTSVIELQHSWRSEIRVVPVVFAPCREPGSLDFKFDGVGVEAKYEWAVEEYGSNGGASSRVVISMRPNILHFRRKHVEEGATQGAHGKHKEGHRWFGCAWFEYPGVSIHATELHHIFVKQRELREVIEVLKECLLGQAILCDDAAKEYADYLKRQRDIESIISKVSSTNVQLKDISDFKAALKVYEENCGGGMQDVMSTRVSLVFDTRENLLNSTELELRARYKCLPRPNPKFAVGETVQVTRLIPESSRYEAQLQAETLKEDMLRCLERLQPHNNEKLLVPLHGRDEFIGETKQDSLMELSSLVAQLVSHYLQTNDVDVAKQLFLFEQAIVGKRMEIVEQARKFVLQLSLSHSKRGCHFCAGSPLADVIGRVLFCSPFSQRYLVESRAGLMVALEDEIKLLESADSTSDV
jgi:hypothetical protein